VVSFYLLYLNAFYFFEHIIHGLFTYVIFFVRPKTLTLVALALSRPCLVLLRTVFALRYIVVTSSFTSFHNCTLLLFHKLYMVVNQILLCFTWRYFLLRRKSNSSIKIWGLIISHNPLSKFI
jgi:hypothetical protein